MMARGAALTGVAKENFENTQATRYASGAYFNKHHDNDPTLTRSPSGNRIFTIFAYLQEADDGGETHFPLLDIKVPSKRGAAILFTNVLNEDPSTTSPTSRKETAACSMTATRPRVTTSPSIRVC